MMKPFSASSPAAAKAPAQRPYLDGDVVLDHEVPVVHGAGDLLDFACDRGLVDTEETLLVLLADPRDHAGVGGGDGHLELHALGQRSLLAQPCEDRV